MTQQSQSTLARSKDVLVVGCTAADIMAKTVDTIPEKGSSAIFDSYEIHVGGNAANTATCLAKLGTTVGISCKVGHDELGRFCVKKMAEAGVRMEGLLYSKDLLTACSLVLVPGDGNRRILHAPGASADFGAKDVKDPVLSRFGWLHVAGFFCLPGLDGFGLEKLLKKAKAFDLTTCLDSSVNHRIPDWYKFIEPALPYLDIIFPSEEEAQCITGKTTPRDMVTFLRERGIKIAGVKLGERGSVISYENEYHEIPAYDVAVVDTCGAGDAFMAGFLLALKDGKSPHEAAQFGNAAGALCIRQLGATSGIPSAEEVAEFQNRTPLKA